MELTRARLIVLGVITTVAIAVITVVLRSERPRDLVLQIEPVYAETTVTVYVGGAVRAPGLYTLPRGSRVAEALEQAGLLDDAEVTSLALAERLRDGQQFFVPHRSARPAPTVALESVAAPASVDRINVNTATASELESLTGIGPVLAQRIIEYRTSHGPFATLDDLANIKGISIRTIEKFRDQATVGD